MKPLCKADGCAVESRTRGWCQRHYQRWQRYGDPLGGQKRAPGEMLEWIVEHSTHNGDECLIWPFDKNRQGYPRKIRRNGVDVGAGRIMCELANGPAPEEHLHAAHNCGKGHMGCIHPKHLQWKTAQENSNDLDLHGTRLFGEKSPVAKLTEEQVRTIFFNCSGHSSKLLAEQFSVSKEIIQHIRNGRAWSRTTGLPKISQRRRSQA